MKETALIILLILSFINGNCRSLYIDDPDKGLYFMSSSKTFFTYDENNNLIKEDYDGLSKTEYYYENNILTREETYNGDALESIINYVYIDDKEVEKNIFLLPFDIEFQVRTFYNDDIKRVINYDENGEAGLVSEYKIDKYGKVIYEYRIDREKEVFVEKEYKYFNELLIYTNNKTKFGTNTQKYYGYNNCGDVIYNLEIHNGVRQSFKATLYRYEYDDEKKAIQVEYIDIDLKRNGIEMIGGLL